MQVDKTIGTYLNFSFILALGDNMDYGFDDFLGRLERLVAGKGSVTKTAHLYGAKADNCIYVFLPDNPELQAMLKKETRTYVLREQMKNKKEVNFVVAENFRCDEFGCTGHYGNPEEESRHCFRNSFPEDISGAYILFKEA